MSTIRISCFGILLKHYLLRHHADAVAPKGRFRPEIDHALLELPADFEIQTFIPAQCQDACLAEECLQVQISLGHQAGLLADRFLLSIRGILSRGRQDQSVHTLMPGRLHLVAQDELELTAIQIRKALSLLALPQLLVVVENESRIGLFRTMYQPRLLQRTRQPREAVKLARVA